MKTMKFLAALAVSVTLGTAASAATCSDAVLDPNYVDCAGLFDGNIQQSGFDFNSSPGNFGFTDWVLIESQPSYQGGDINLPTDEWNMVAILLKAGNSWGSYLFSGGSLEEWWNNGLTVTSTAVNSLSNYSIYGRNDTSVVPLPAAGWLLIAGLGGMVALGRRRKAD